MSSSIPRFLLPQRGLIWRRVAAGSLHPSSASTTTQNQIITRRLASTKPSPTGPRVLEKPERFNPPSHGSRLPKKQIPRHYGGDLSEAERTVQAQRDYPMTMPAKGTWAHWFLHSRWIHLVITMGSLASLAIYTMILNFKSTSPFADMLPSYEDLLWHPIDSTRMAIEVIQLTESHKTRRIQEKRKRAIEDVQKRAEYRKAHGLPEEMGLFNMKRATINMDGDAEKKPAAAAVDDASPVATTAGEEAAAAPVEAKARKNEPVEVRRLTEEEQRKVVESTKGKWLGVF
ncbi:hypothetical protein QBC35DRAFT_491767 [Podospora australis]|uniref:Uncharacterized protein n=1 Tax=Podospora australis TaxID=1536484 RepID=A0AAN7AL22_9PEZI|nr:hypothetical protein QBC35DRAFT_491767 [Podospora australis]